MTPQRSYRIWFSQRNGSTLLCKGLEDTGIAGRPGEFFNVMDKESLCSKFRAENYSELRQKIWEAGSTPNGVFGIKHSMHTDRYAKIYKEIADLRGMSPASPEMIMEDLFPNCQHIYLTRRNKVRQAVSWWKAIQDQTWHLAPGQKQQTPTGFYEERYDFEALKHLFTEANLRECAIQAYFSRHQIRPLTLVYEDFSQDFAKGILQVLDYLGLELSKDQTPKKYFRRTANSGSEEWVQRFRKDLQKDMSHTIW